MVVLFIIVALLLGLIPAFIARKSGRNFWLWWPYGTVAWMVALIHVLVAKPPAQGGTGTFGKVTAAILGSGSALIFMLSVIGMSVAEDPDELMTATGHSVQTETSPAVQQTPEQATHVPDYKIVEERDTSHGAANRITFWLRLENNESEDGIRMVIKDVIARHRDRYDIIWLEVVPKDGQPRGEGFYGWRPVISSAKWISPSLDEQYHTTIAGPNTGEIIDGIVVAWTMGAKARQGKPEPAPVKPTPPSEPTEKQRDVVTPKSPFDPGTIIGRLQDPRFCAEVANIQWQRHDLSDGQERWLGRTADSVLIFEITPDWLYVMGSIANTKSTSNTLLAFYELNSIAMPDNYEKVNNGILPEMIDETSLEKDFKQSREFAGWLLELQGLQTFVSISYKISRAREK